MLPNFVEGGFTSQVSGWGATESDKGENANQLRILNVITVDQQECKDLHGVRVTDGHICARGILPSTGICTTDVGEYLRTWLLSFFKINILQVVL